MSSAPAAPPNRRFDKLDANHDGILTADERRAAREERAARRAARSQSQ
jgi:hypothetical protein